MGKHHDQKDIDSAIAEAIDDGMEWIKQKKGHHAGQLVCSHGPNPNCPYGCKFWVSGTPRSGQTEAKKISQWIKRCKHSDEL